MSGFEGSFLGQGERIDDAAVLECGVCWWVYDPARGDPIWQIEAGTPFTRLPAHWRCPHCDTPPEQFMVLSSPGQAAGAAVPVRRENQASLRDTLHEAYRAAEGRMRSLPVYRADLPTGVLGPRRCEAGEVLLVFTPWCMNLVLRSDDTERLFEGSERTVELPTGAYPFVRAFLDGVGAIETCSLFSPMDEFENAAAVEAVAREAFQALFSAPEQPEYPPTGDLEDPSRRRFLGAGLAAG